MIFRKELATFQTNENILVEGLFLSFLCGFLIEKFIVQPLHNEMSIAAMRTNALLIPSMVAIGIDTVTSGHIHAIDFLPSCLSLIGILAAQNI